MTAKRGAGNPNENYLRERYDRLSLRIKSGYAEKLEKLRVKLGFKSVTKLIEAWADEEKSRPKKK
jgi:hypothetical protein